MGPPPVGVLVACVSILAACASMSPVKDMRPVSVKPLRPSCVSVGVAVRGSGISFRIKARVLGPCLSFKADDPHHRGRW